MLTSTHAHETHHATTAGAVHALWSLRGGTAFVSVVRDTASDKPGYRWPAEEQPNWPAGEIAFVPGEYPSLAQAREWLPEYGDLWDAITAETATDLLAEPAPGTPAAAHRMFFALPV